MITITEELEPITMPNGHVLVRFVMSEIPTPGWLNDFEIETQAALAQVVNVAYRFAGGQLTLQAIMAMREQGIAGAYNLVDRTNRRHTARLEQEARVRARRT